MQPLKPLADSIVHNMLGRKRPSLFWKKNLYILPELEEAKKIIQRCGQTVFVHTMNVLDVLETKDDVTLFAALFHDLGKVYTKTIDQQGIINFHGHEQVSVAIANQTLKEWQAKPDIIHKVTRIISMHMLDIRNSATKRAIRNFIAFVGKDNIENWFILRRADSASYSKVDAYQKAIIDPFHKLVKKELKISTDDNDDGPNASNGGMRISGDM